MWMGNAEHTGKLVPPHPQTGKPATRLREMLRCSVPTAPIITGGPVLGLFLAEKMAAPVAAGSLNSRTSRRKR